MTKDKRYFAVACIEPQFFNIFVTGLSLKEDEVKWLKENQWNEGEWEKIRKMIGDAIGSQTSKHWKDKVSKIIW